MKFKKFKKCLSMVLTMAILCGMIVVPDSPVSLVTKVEASIVSGGQYYIRNVHTGMFLTAVTTGVDTNVEQRNFNNNTRQRWRIESSGSEFTLTPMSATGSRLTLNGIQARVEVNTGGPLQRWRLGRMTSLVRGNLYRITPDTMTTQSLRPASTAEGALIERGNHTGANIQHWQLIPVSVVSNPAQVIRNVNIRYDESFRGSHPAPTNYLNAIFGSVASTGSGGGGLLNAFGMVFNRQSTLLSDDLDGSHTSTNGNCNKRNDRICALTPVPSCGTLHNCFTSDNATTNHHKSARRILGLLGDSTPNYTIRVVGHAICAWSGGEHIGLNGPSIWLIGGLAFVGGRDSMLTSEMGNVWTLDVLMQHELGHGDVK